jgi:hypothetical protein
MHAAGFYCTSSFTAAPNVTFVVLNRVDIARPDTSGKVHHALNILNAAAAAVARDAARTLPAAFE